jgi:cellobiose phosphorylase
MRYGHFDDARREYVVTRADTPLPWFNYLGCQDLFSLLSHTASGYTFYRDARLRRLTRYRYHLPAESGSRFLYLRDDQASPADVWCPTGQPVLRGLEAFECRHGLGYSRISSTHAEIECQAVFFVPLDEDAEIWHVTVTNHRRLPVELSVFGAVEFCLWDALDDATNFQRNLSLAEVEVDAGVIYHKTEYRERRRHFATFSCSAPGGGFDTDRSAFLGPGRGWEDPRAVESGAMGDSIASGWYPIGAHRVPLNLAPGEARTIVFALGYHENSSDSKFDPPGSSTLNKRAARERIERWLKVDDGRRALDTLGVYWDDLLSQLHVTTPNEHVDRIVNTWNPYQVMATFNLSRSASYFESGVGRGIGFRDASQDLLGCVHFIPGRARQRLIDLASTQLEDGGAYHQYQPLTRRGNHDIGGGFNDDPLWLVLATAAYIRETGDWSLLDVTAPFDQRPGSEASIHEHLRRAIGYTLARLGPHGLPLIGRADWNDCLNLNTFSTEPGASFQTAPIRPGEVAESVFIGGLFLLAAEAMHAMQRHLGDDEAADELAGSLGAMRDAVDSAGWDGRWFLRAYDSAGRAVGSHACEDGQIYIEPQGMCVMAGLGIDDGRARSALDSVAERLATPHGIDLLDPPYHTYQVHLGEISSYPPGYKENGGIFCHTNPWVMIAETRIGRAEAALDYYLRINPSMREAMSEVHACEPYVYAQMIAGREAPLHGQAKNSWLTGTAAWNYVAITEWILGIRPDFDGLVVAPVVPDAWDGFEVVRRFRGSEYHVRARRVGPGGEVRLSVDGRPLDGNLVPPAAPGSRVEVTALLGRPDANGIGLAGPGS